MLTAWPHVGASLPAWVCRLQELKEEGLPSAGQGRRAANHRMDSIES